MTIKREIEGKYALLRVIGRIGQDAWIHPSLNSIRGSHNHPICVGMKEVIIKDETPYRVHEFPSAMCENIFMLSAPFMME